MSIKQIILSSLKLSGVYSRLSSSAWRSERLLILCYHGISLADEHEWRATSFMSPEQFESRMKMLREGNYNVLPLGEAIEKLYTNTLPPRSVAITFDDGLYNFYSRAVPILKKYSLPSTLYFNTYYCEPQRPIFPLIASYLFWKARNYVMPANPFLGFDHSLDLSQESVRLQAETDFAAFSARFDQNSDEKNDLVRLLAGHLGCDFDQLSQSRMFNLMTPAEVKQLHSEGVDIQLHTHRHRTPKDEALYRKEITDNREKIVEYIGQNPIHYCYPSGVYRQENLPWLKDLGVVSATTCDHALADRESHPLLLPRFLDSSNVNPLEFESWLTGVGPYLRKVLRA